MSEKTLVTPALSAPVSDAVLLEIRDLSVSFSTRRGPVDAVKNASLQLARGSKLAIVGESGSGKSTMSAAVNRLLPGNAVIKSGQIFFEGRDLVQLKPHEMVNVRGAGIGLVPQDPMSNLDPVHRIGDQIVEALTAHGTTGKAAKARAIQLLGMVGIPDPETRFRQYPHEFSGGMRQRVLIAIGLACKPQLLIADEPTSALDVTVQRQVLDELERLTTEMGTSLFMITHDLGLAAERADEVLVMFRGEIVEHGSALQILEDPQHEYTKRLLAAAPGLAVRRGDAKLPTPYAARGGDGSDPIVELRDVRKQYSLRGGLFAKRKTLNAVESSTFTIPRGSTVAIVGESGSGKSTTARMVLRLEKPTSGSVLVDGIDIATLDAAGVRRFRERVQPVFQNPYASLDSLFTVGDTIEEPLKVHKRGAPEERKARVRELLEEVALPADFVSRYPHELSGGQRQRVAIARALALNPQLVVLDEAVSALDVIVQAQILELLARLQREHGLSYLFISHDLAVVRQISDFVHVMSRGRIVESGTPDEIFDDPQQNYTKKLLAAIPGAHLG